MADRDHAFLLRGLGRDRSPSDRLASSDKARIETRHRKIPQSEKSPGDPKMQEIVRPDPAVRIEETLAAILSDGLVLAIRLKEKDQILDVCHAAVKGGIKILEITLTTPGAIEAIGELSSNKGLLVGGGTALTISDVAAIAQAGGRFAMSPVFDPEVVDESERFGLLAVPGTATPNEIMAAHRHGARLVKVFPSGPLGGPDFLRFVRGPLPEIPLIPTSGPTADNLEEYLAAGAVALGVGRDVFVKGFSLSSIEDSARKLRETITKARR